VCTEGDQGHSQRMGKQTCKAAPEAKAVAGRLPSHPFPHIPTSHRRQTSSPHEAVASELLSRNHLPLCHRPRRWRECLHLLLKPTRPLPLRICRSRRKAPLLLQPVTCVRRMASSPVQLGSSSSKRGNQPTLRVGHRHSLRELPQRPHPRAPSSRSPCRLRRRQPWPSSRYNNPRPPPPPLPLLSQKHKALRPVQARTSPPSSKTRTRTVCCQLSSGVGVAGPSPQWRPRRLRL